MVDRDTEPATERSDRDWSRATSSSGFLNRKTARSSLPRYRLRTEGSKGSIYAFRLRRVPHWVLIGRGWVSNLSDADFVRLYRPSNQVARDLFYNKKEQ